MPPLSSGASHDNVSELVPILEAVGVDGERGSARIENKLVSLKSRKQRVSPVILE